MLYLINAIEKKAILLNQASFRSRFFYMAFRHLHNRIILAISSGKNVLRREFQRVWESFHCVKESIMCVTVYAYVSSDALSTHLRVSGFCS